MTGSDLLVNPLFPRALVIGVLGGVSLALTARFSRRGPMILPVYAAMLCALAFLLARYSTMTFAVLFTAAFSGHLVASVILYAGVNRRARPGG